MTVQPFHLIFNGLRNYNKWQRQTVSFYTSFYLSASTRGIYQHLAFSGWSELFLTSTKFSDCVCLVDGFAIWKMYNEQNLETQLMITFSWKKFIAPKMMFMLIRRGRFGYISFVQVDFKTKMSKTMFWRESLGFSQSCKRKTFRPESKNVGKFNIMFFVVSLFQWYSGDNSSSNFHSYNNLRNTIDTFKKLFWLSIEVIKCGLL